MSKKRLSRDQKRKQKVAEKKKRTVTGSLLAYEGNKWKSDHFLPLVQETELAIHGMDMVSRREMSDEDVRRALEFLVRQLRAGEPLPPGGEIHLVPGEFDRAIVNSILQSWERLYEERPRDRREDQVGVLRTLLSSLNVWGARNVSSRGYLTFLEGFLGRMGVRMRVKDEEGHPLDEEEDPLLDLGRDWCEGDEDAGKEFHIEMNDLIDRGEGKRVVELTQRLMGEYADGGRPLIQHLSALTVQAQTTRPRLP